MKAYLYLIVAFFCLSANGSILTQDEIVYDDHVYMDHIRSVQFSIDGLPTSVPIVDLYGSGNLRLEFDDILGGDRDYTYRLIHCDRNWNPSDLMESDYIDGFNDEDIRTFDYSVGTRTDYTHYQLQLPNNDVTWRISGNYILLVTDDDSDELALSRRFMVTDQKVSIDLDIRRAMTTNLSLTHQELFFEINNKNFPIPNPQRELSVTLMQNGRWDLAIENITPVFTSGDRIIFDRTKRLSFPAFNQFRGIDIRSLRTRGLGISGIEISEDGALFVVEIDERRYGQILTNLSDLNGNFIIETVEYNQDDVRSDYVDVSWALESLQPILDASVYVVGKFCDWQPKEEYRLQYDATEGLYIGEGMLKQGYYDYQFMVEYDDGERDYTYFEGSHYATENDYQVLVYYRPLTGRYDQLIGVTSPKSNF